MSFALNLVAALILGVTLLTGLDVLPAALELKLAGIFVCSGLIVHHVHVAVKPHLCKMRTFTKRRSGSDPP